MLVKPVRGIRQLNSNNNILSNLENTSLTPSLEVLESCIKQEITAKGFMKEETPSFYLCRYTSGDHVCQGIIAQVDCRYLNGRIIKHEECYIEKLAEFYKIFNDFNFQSAPTLLFHKEDIDIETYIDRIMRSMQPDLTFYSYNCIYELWITYNNEKLLELYNSIENFFIADGHHRISHLYHLQMNALAYIVPETHLRTYPIIREYNGYYNSQLQDLIGEIRMDFSLNVLNEGILGLLQKNNFILSYNMQKLHISPSDSAEYFQQILNIFSSINFTPDGKLNFKNYKNELDDITSEKTKIIKNSKNLNQLNFHLYIPAITPKLIYTTLNKPLPIHSTWFEPKIPSGIIGMELRDTEEDHALGPYYKKASNAFRT